MSKKPSETLPPYVAHYDTGRKNYWIKDRNQNWIEINETALKRHLKGYGLNPNTERGDVLSEIDMALNDYQLDYSVAYAGALAGYHMGLREQCGNRILVTSEAKPIKPKAGQWPLLQQLLENLFTDDVADQLPYVFGWLKVAVEAMQANVIRPGQAFAKAGVRNSGKSLWDNIVTEILGGRAAKPYRYMSGMTPFNGELFGAEHLIVEDEFASHDLRKRREFGARIKDATVNEVQSCHAKNRQAISLRPFWRLSISLNDEPENLAILPPLDESLVDKIILLRAHYSDMPMPTESPEQRTAFWAALMAELPAFVHWLMQWKIPEAYRCPRFGVKSWQHPVLLESISELSPETRLLSLIDAVLFENTTVATAPINLTAGDIERKLVNSEMGYEARRLLKWDNACGTYLGRLAVKHPDRITHQRTNSNRMWCLKPQ